MRRFSLRLPPVFPQVMISQVMLWGTLVGAGTGLGMVAPILAPQAAIAYEARTTVTIDHEPGESYNTLLRRAEAVGRAAAQRYFDNDILVTEVQIFVNAQKHGLEAPLLAIQASRFQWNSLPDARRWAEYYNNTRNLLGLEYSAPDAPATAARSENRSGAVAIESPAVTPLGSPASNLAAGPARNPATNPALAPTSAGPDPIFSSPIFTPTGNTSARSQSSGASSGASSSPASTPGEQAPILVPIAPTGSTDPLSLPTADPLAPDPTGSINATAPDSRDATDALANLQGLEIQGDETAPPNSDLPNPFRSNVEGDSSNP